MKILTIFSLLCFTFNLYAYTYTDRQRARTDIELACRSNEICNATITKCRQTLDGIKDRIESLEKMHTKEKKTQNVLRAVKTYVESSNLSLENLNDVVSAVSTWEKNNSNREDMGAVSDLLGLLAALEKCHGDLKKENKDIISWLIDLSDGNLADISKLIENACNERFSELEKIEDQNSIVRQNNERISQKSKIANSLSVVQLKSDGIRNGQNYCNYMGGWRCVYTDAFEHDCTTRNPPEGSTVWCLADGEPAAGEGINGPVSVHHSYQGRNGHNYCSYWGGENYKCIYTSKGMDCTSSLSDSEYVWCLKIR